jgi:8-oxo-dGTP pyrophosphatase MutT (NUDIX family)
VPARSERLRQDHHPQYSCRAAAADQRVGFHAGIDPKGAATLIIVDRTETEPKVLLGRRHARHVFLPGKFVFPGGRVDAVALALAAIRETFEETGLLIGTKDAAGADAPSGLWTPFVQTGFYPDPSQMRFVLRAITPPGFARRFDARFFCVDSRAIAHRLENVVHPDAELIELVWLPITAASGMDLPIITGLALEELKSIVARDLRSDLPVPFCDTRDGDFTRELIA